MGQQSPFTRGAAHVRSRGVERKQSELKRTSPHKGRFGALPATGSLGSWWRGPAGEALSCG